MPDVPVGSWLTVNVPLISEADTEIALHDGSLPLPLDFKKYPLVP